MLAASASAAETPCHLIASGADGPTVILNAGAAGAGYAADQMRLWHLAHGRLIIVPSAEKSEELAGSAPVSGKIDLDAPALAGAWRIRLDDDEAKLPAEAPQASVLECAPGSSAEKTAQALLEKLNGELPAGAAPCESRKSGVAAASPTLRYITHAPKLTLAVRAREHRLLVHALLTQLQMLAPETTPETMVDPASAKRVAVFDGEGSAGAGVPNCLAQLRVQPGVAVTRVAADDITAGALAQFTVAMFTGGSGSRQAATLGETGRERVGEFVRGGGGYIGICAGSYLACKGFSWGLGIINAKTPSPKWQRGRALLKIELNDEGRSVLGNIQGETDCRYGNGPLLVPAGAPDLPPFEVLALFRTEVAEHGTPAGIMVNSPAVIRSTFGKGRVLCISPHPEQTEGLEGVVPRAVAWVTAAKN
jgi:hypothetical protein